jgi:hypothetical protein
MSQEAFLADLYGPVETIQQLQQAVRKWLEGNLRLRFCRAGLSSPTRESLAELRTRAEVLIGVRGRETLRSRGELPERYANTSGFYLEVSLAEAQSAYMSSVADLSTYLGYAQSLLAGYDGAQQVSVETDSSYKHDFGYGPYAYEPGSYLKAGGTLYLPGITREVIGSKEVPAGELLTGTLVVQSDLGDRSYVFERKSVDDIAVALQDVGYTATVRERRLVITATDAVRCLRVQQTQLAKLLGLPKSQLQTARGYVSAENLAERVGGTVERACIYRGAMSVEAGVVQAPLLRQRATVVASSGDIFIVDNGQLHDYANLVPVDQITALSAAVYAERVTVQMSEQATDSGVPVGVTSLSNRVYAGVAVEAGDRIGGAEVVAVSLSGQIELDREIDEGEHLFTVVGQAELYGLISALRAITDEPDLAAIDRAIEARREYGRVRYLTKYMSAWRAVISQHTERGFDRAADLLNASRMDDYFACTATTASYATLVSDAVQEVSKAVYLA